MRRLDPRCTRRTAAPVTRPRGDGERVDPAAVERDALYRTPTWRKLRRLHLREHPLCVRCLALSPPRYVKATVVDHIRGHHADWRECFFDAEGLQSLCATCHSAKTRDELATKAERVRTETREEIARLRAARPS